MILADDVAALFGRHLDLRRLRGRPRGLVRCIFHDDGTASLSLDLERGLFHCFGCRAGGGVTHFAELVGERPVLDPPRPPRLTWFNIRREALRLARSQPWARAGVVDLYHGADVLRAACHRIATARRVATAAGDTPSAWALLADAAHLETAAFEIEAALDDAVPAVMQRRRA